MNWFYQDGPELRNPFEEDKILQNILQTFLPEDVYNKVKIDLMKLGQRVVDEIDGLGKQAEMEEPQLVNFDVWGKRVDRLVISNAWDKLKDISAEEGLVSIGYKRQFGIYSRLVQFAKLHLFTPSSAIYTCPLAMTDGAARLLELYGSDALKEKYLEKYISTDPSEFFVSGQWMTERTGGSDLARTETIARKVDGQWRLFGPKWFTSAITADTAMTLARIEDEIGSPKGSRGLSVFILEIYEDGSPNNLQIDRLKDKLGTRALPTAELELEGVPAELVGVRNMGIKTIATLLNITRTYNAISAVSYAQRAVQLATEYASKREAFGSKIGKLPLHKEILARSQNIVTGCEYLTFFTVLLMGKEECNEATEEEQLILRLLIPVIKLYTAKLCFSVVSEMVEAIGGVGYLEDSGFPQLLRDSQVFSIWEGTTNVLSLDVLRVISKTDALSKWSEFMSDVENESVKSEIKKLISTVRSADDISSIARRLSFSIGKLSVASLLSRFTKDNDLVSFWLDVEKIDYLT